MPYRPLLPVLTALSLVIASLLTGCASTGAALHHTLRLPLYGKPIRPDPAQTSTLSSIFLNSLLYSGLVKLSPDLHVVPELAVSLPTISDGGRTYTFTIRHDARFSDGRHVTASDVAYSLTRALSPATHSPLAARYLGDIEGAQAVENGDARSLSGVQAVDRLTVRVHLGRPQANFLESLAFPVASVVEPGVPLPRAGTGAWVLVGRSRSGDLLLVPRRHFYGGQLSLRELLLTPVASAGEAMTLYRKNHLDAARVPFGQWKGAAGKSDFQQSPSLEAYYALPQEDGRTLASRLDRNQLAAGLIPGLSPLDAIVPPAIPDYVASPPGFGATGDARHALDIVAERGDSAAQSLRHALYQQWPAGGTRAWHLRIIHRSFLRPDPLVWLRRVIPRKSQTSWYRSTLKHAADLTNDPVTRMSLYSTAETSALRKGEVIPLASTNIGYLIKPSVQGMQVTPLGLMPANNAWAAANVSS